MGQLKQVKGLSTGDHVRGDETDQHHRAADERVDRQLHRAVFLARGTPDRDQEIFWDDCQFVKDEEKKNIEAEEHTIDTADQREVEREIFLGTMFDVPRKQHSGYRGDTGEQHKGDADPVHGDKKICAEGWDPSDFADRHNSGGKAG